MNNSHNFVIMIALKRRIIMHLLEGKISVKAALLSPYRKVDRILIDKNKKDKDTAFIKHKAKEQEVSVILCDRKKIDTLAQGKTHGGIVAYVYERDFQNIEEIIHDNCFLAIVEGVEDPFNFGYVLRSLYAAGVDAIIMGERNWTSAAATLSKSSAGASEFLPMVITHDFDETLTYLKAQSIKIVCAQRDEHSLEMYDYDYTSSICICIGGEKRGLSKAILNHSDQNIYIPYENNFRNALSAASASTILAYEVMRQRKQSHK